MASRSESWLRGGTSGVPNLDAGKLGRSDDKAGSMLSRGLAQRHGMTERSLRLSSNSVGPAGVQAGHTFFRPWTACSMLFHVLQALAMSFFPEQAMESDLEHLGQHCSSMGPREPKPSWPRYRLALSSNPPGAGSGWLSGC